MFAADRAGVECDRCRAPAADRRGAERGLRQRRQRDDAQAWPDLQPRRRLHIESILGQVLQGADAVSALQQQERLSRCYPEPLRRYRSEDHTSELQSLMRNSYAVLCLKKQTQLYTRHTAKYYMLQLQLQ